MPNTIKTPNIDHNFYFMESSKENLATLPKEIFTSKISTPFGNGQLLWCKDYILRFDLEPQGQVPKRPPSKRAGAKIFLQLEQQATAKNKDCPDIFNDPQNFLAIGSKKAIAVWEALIKVPSGSTVSYAELAENAYNSRKSARACASFVGANPIIWFIPCHRVIASDGRLTGFGGGLKLKEKMLASEKIN